MPNAPDLWEPGTTITLCQVPWDASYNDVIYWDEQGTVKAAYFEELLKASPAISLGQSTYVKVGEPVQVAVPYTTARLYNYCVVTNPRLPSDIDEPEGTPTKYPATYYYFITKAEQSNPASTRLSLQLDLWTTYYPDFIDFGVGYVERGHVAMANAPLADASGDLLPYALNRYCSVAEGIDVGSEMQTVDETFVSLQSPIEVSDAGVITQGDPLPQYIFIVATADLTKNPGTIDNPTLKTSTGGTYWGLFSGSSVYACEASSWGSYAAKLQECSWVSQCIISITQVPRAMVDDSQLTERNFLGDEGLKFWELTSTAQGDDLSTFKDAGGISLSYAEQRGWASSPFDWMQGHQASYDLSKYRGLQKLWAYPYTVFELHGNGQSVFLKPELFGRNLLPLKMVAQGVAPFASVAVFPDGYGTYYQQAVTETSTNSNSRVKNVVHYGDFLDVALWWDDFPQFSVTNNSYIAYMASSAHSRSYSYESAEWSYTSSNLGSDNTYANAALGLQNAYSTATAEIANQQQNYQISNATRQSAIGTSVAQGVAGAVGNVLSGNIGGAVSGAISTGLSTLQAEKELKASMAMQANNIALAQSNLAGNQATGYAIADNNLALSRSVAQGNYANQVAGINAGIRDAALKTPSSSGNVGGAGMRYSNGLYFNFSIRMKRISPEAICRVGDYFYRFGYAIKRFMKVPDTLVFNRHYSYWQMSQLDVKSAWLSETDKDAFRGIAQKGFTVWRKPSDIGSVVPTDNQLQRGYVAEYYV